MITTNYQFSPSFGIGGRSRVVSETRASLGSASNPVPSVKWSDTSKMSKSQLAEIKAKQEEYRNKGCGSYSGPEQERSYGGRGSDSYNGSTQERSCGEIRPSFLEHLYASEGRATNEQYNKKIAEEEAKIAKYKAALEKLGSSHSFDRQLIKEKIAECEYWRDYAEFRRDCT